MERLGRSAIVLEFNRAAVALVKAPGMTLRLCTRLGRNLQTEPNPEGACDVEGTSRIICGNGRSGFSSSMVDRESLDARGRFAMKDLARDETGFVLGAGIDRHGIPPEIGDLRCICRGLSRQ